MSITFTIGRYMRILVVMMSLVGCGGGDPKPPIDALDVSCSNYCMEIQKNCTGVNAQYGDATECMAACTSFPPGTGTAPDNTLGCRFYYASAPAMMPAEDYCPRAGPAGDKISTGPGAYCSGSDVCNGFCALEIQACGSIEAPLPGNPTDPTGNTLFQYRNMVRCVTACDGLDKSHTYSTTAVGNSLACRLYRAVKAAVRGSTAMYDNAAMYCATTGSNPDPASDCGGAASP